MLLYLSNVLSLNLADGIAEEVIFGSPAWLEQFNFPWLHLL